GMGCAGIGNLYRSVSNAEACETVEAALAHGIGFFDTAPYYGFGLAEQRLGKLLATSDDGRRAMISTKVGRVLHPCAEPGERHGFVDAAPFKPRFDYSRDGVLRSFESSLSRLRRSRVELLLAHDLGEVTHGAEHEPHLRNFLDQGYGAMRELRDSGAVGAIGIGVNEIPICLDLIARVELDVILLAGRYTLLEQGALERLLPLCVERGIRVIIGGPFNSGILAHADPGGCYNYAAAPAGIAGKARRIGAICARHGVALPAAALAMPAAHPAVASIIPGLVGAAQVVSAMANWGAEIPAALWDELRGEGLISAATPLPSHRRAA
ncbi:MAG: aldo/keto reductase, partial [Novosphingobium sp.]